VKPEFRVLDRRGFAAGARPEPVVRYPGGAASDGADYDALAAIAEMQYILRKYLAPELRGTSPEIRPTDSLNEASLQAQRMRALQVGNMTEYNRLIEAHRNLYRTRGVDPCRSAFFPQGCSQ
jgi:hypothetical protein